MNAGLLAACIIGAYLLSLIVLGLVSNRYFRGTAMDYFAASHGLGAVLLLLAIFGTTMTAFAMQGSSGEAFESGIMVFGKMASWSAIVHPLCFFLVGTKLWALGRKYGYLTQIQFFRDRFESNGLGLVLFPILTGLVVIYILTAVIGSGTVIAKVTEGAFPGVFAATKGAVPYSLASAVACGVVLIYVWFGGIRSAAWANAFQTILFVAVGIVTFVVIAQRLGGADRATELVEQYNPTRLHRAVSAEDRAAYERGVAAFEADPAVAVQKPRMPQRVSHLEFLSYGFIPLSVAMFPHLFQLWLTAKSARAFRLTVVAHPVLIMVVWLPCVLIGAWATSAVVDGKPVIPADFANPNAVLALMVRRLAHPALGGLLAAGILAAILGGLDAQFICLGSIFTNDIVGHYIRHDRLSDAQRLHLGRLFVVLIVAVTYVLSIVLTETRGIFALGVWCFSGFAGLFPLVFAALYWRRMTKAGAYASTLAAAGAWSWLFVKSDYGAGGEVLVLGMLPVATIAAVATAALVVVSLLTQPPSEATVARFFPVRAQRLTAERR